MLFFAILATILFFGLDPKGFQAENHVTWLKDRPGIRFGRYGMAFTRSSFDPTPSDPQRTPQLTIEIALKPDSTDNDGFKFILVFHNGDDNRQLLVGQWRDSIIIMNGDDYDGRKKVKKTGVKNALPSGKETFVAITSGDDGTKVYLNGEFAAGRKNLFLEIPNEAKKARLVLGNSIYGRHSWYGDIFGLALYADVLTPASIASHYRHWTIQQQFAFGDSNKLTALYRFDEKQGEQAFDQAGGRHHLAIPRRVEVLKKEMLVAPWHGVKLNRSLALDVLLNFFGFVPVGFLFAWICRSLTGSLNQRRQWLIVGGCFLVSLIVEIAQSWLPSRSSQVLDLILNTFGAWLGVTLYALALRKAEKI